MWLVIMYNPLTWKQNYIVTWPSTGARSKLKSSEDEVWLNHWLCGWKMRCGLITGWQSTQTKSACHMIFARNNVAMLWSACHWVHGTCCLCTLSASALETCFWSLYIHCSSIVTLGNIFAINGYLTVSFLALLHTMQTVNFSLTSSFHALYATQLVNLISKDTWVKVS